MKAAIALSIVMLALIAATAATAGRVPSTISLRLGPSVGLFSGKVQSPKSACVMHRKVRIVRVSGQDVRVAKGHTDSKGRYSIQTDEQSGDWLAKVKHGRLGGVDCKGAQSTIRSAG